jgi:hypothetical protein
VEIELIKDFIKEQCPGKSGQSREHYYQRITSDDLYSRYRKQHNEMLFEMLQHLSSEGPLVAKSSAFDTLASKLKRHEQELAFLSFVRSDPASQDAFAGGHLPGPAQIPLDYLLDQLSVPPLPSPRSRKAFEAVKDEMPLSVLHRYYGQFACATCAHGLSALADLKRLKSVADPSAEQAKEIEKAEEWVEKYEWHLKVLASQMPTVEKLFDVIPVDTALVLMDFGSYRTEVNVADKDKAPWTSLVLVVEEKSSRTYVDVLIKDRSKQKGDFWFLRAALLYILLATDLLSKFAHLIFITDTSSKQFRSRYEFAFFGALAELVGKSIRLLYRAERHGHSLCDSHIGLVAQAITRFLNQIEAQSKQFPSQSATLLSPLADINTLSKLLQDTFKDKPDRKYRCVVLDDIDRTDRLRPKVRVVPGTMKLHDISYESPTVLLAKQLSTDPEHDVVRLRFDKSWKLSPGSGQSRVFMLATNLILVACVLGASAAAGAASASKPDTGKGLFVARVCVGTDFRPCSGGSSMSLGSDEAMAASTHHAEKRQRVSADEAPMDTAPDTHTPSVILSDADADLFSKLTYEEAAALDARHVNVICQLTGQDYKRWRVSEIWSDPKSREFEVRLREWPRITVRVPSNRLHKHSSSLSV